ncbi:MAG: hypothetical protein ACREL9_06170 [Gemmatimonadales bacterium]
MLALVLAMVTAKPDAADAQAGWRRKAQVDAITDDSIRLVSTTTEGGYEFAVYRIAHGRVWARFSVPDFNLDVIAHDRLLIYRVDGGEPFDVGAQLAIQRYLSTPTIQAEPKWVNFVIWHGEGGSIGKGLSHMATGKKLLVRYFVFTGGYRDIAFSLDGFAEALRWVLERDQ